MNMTRLTSTLIDAAMTFMCSNRKPHWRGVPLCWDGRAGWVAVGSDGPSTGGARSQSGDVDGRAVEASSAGAGHGRARGERGDEPGGPVRGVGAGAAADHPGSGAGGAAGFWAAD